MVEMARRSDPSTAFKFDLDSNLLKTQLKNRKAVGNKQTDSSIQEIDNKQHKSRAYQEFMKGELW